MSIQWSILQLLAASVLALSSPPCTPFYVRWPRVRLNFKSVASARLSLRACQSACSIGEDPVEQGHSLECAAINHHPSPDGFSHHCDVFQPHQLQNVDGYVEADDRYSFYWKYCLNSTRKCGGDYAFTYLSDRYMDGREVIRISKKSSLEECLTECIEETSFACRSISFNRTDGGCHLSDESQLTKPRSIRLNNNPNFRIDYYENNCYNLSETFKFEQQCLEDGVLLKVKSKFPYTGAFYGTYDFFSCRIEPKQEKEFELFFPSPLASKNCSESMRFKGDEMILETVLSTDGIEPLYFLTPDDLTYQAKCPISGELKQRQIETNQILANDEKKEVAASAHALFSMLAKESKEEILRGIGESESSSTTHKPSTKETFPLLLTTEPPKSLENSPPTTTTTSTKRHEVTRSLNSSQFSPSTPDHQNTTSLGTVNIADSNGFKPPIYVKMSANALDEARNHSNTSSNLNTVTTTTTRQTTTQRFVTMNPSTVSSTLSTSLLSTQPSTTKTTSLFSVPTYKPFVSPSHSPNLTAASPNSRPAEFFTATPMTTSRTEKSSTASSQTTTTTKIIPPPTQSAQLLPSSTLLIGGAKPPAHTQTTNETNKESFQSGIVKPRQPVQFDIYHNGHAVEAVVVGSKVTLSFTPHYAISPDYMSLQKCQIEPVDPRYDWEREPVRIIDDGCPSDLVGLACPPTFSEYGIKVTVESFRYQTTPQIQYSCLVRICPFAPCPTNMCHPVDGCSPRRLRDATGQDGLPLQNPMANFNEQQLLALGGEHIVKRRLVVVNSEDQLRYYVRTGDIP